jgi:hypothetical protein
MTIRESFAKLYIGLITIMYFIMARANGRQNKDCSNGVPRINQYLLFVLPLFLEKKTEEMCIICLDKLCPASL